MTGLFHITVCLGLSLVAACVSVPPFLWPTRAPLRGPTTLCLHQVGGGPFGCFHSLVIVNNAAVDIDIEYCFNYCDVYSFTLVFCGTIVKSSNYQSGFSKNL